MQEAGLDDIYKKIAKGECQEYVKLLALQGFFTGILDFDPITNTPLPTTVDDILFRILGVNLEPAWWNDRFQNVIDFSTPAIKKLLDILHEKNLREHRISRPERVHEIDTRCMIWLAKKPGFTIKQKIASSQKMMGVYHTTSIDTTENRLFKAYLQKLDDILYEKEAAVKQCGLPVSDETAQLISTIHSWLRSDESAQIAMWNNVPPNNTLLSDKNYLKIWKSWLALQKIQDQNEQDLKKNGYFKAQVVFLLAIAKMNLSDQVRFRQTLVAADYEQMTITNARGTSLVFEGWCNKKAKDVNWQRIKAEIVNNDVVFEIGKDKTVFSVPAELNLLSELRSFADEICKNLFPELTFNYTPKEQVANCSMAAVDLNSIMPFYTCFDAGKICRQGKFASKLLYQEATSEGEDAPLSYSCSNSKYIVHNKTTKTISIQSIFDSSLHHDLDAKDNAEVVNKACADFAHTIKAQLNTQKCIYVTGDIVDDFSPSVNAFKRNLNVAFVRAEILPRSIAAVFCNFDVIKNRYKDGDKIVVRNLHDDYEIVTELKISINEELREKNPQTNGIQFQRLEYHREEVKKAPVCATPLEKVLSIRDANLLVGKFTANDFHFQKTSQVNTKQVTAGEIIVTAESDVSKGAIKYRQLQDISPDIYLWCDFLPRLSMIDSSNKEFVLVHPKKVTIQPIVGKPVLIPIDDHFSFPAKKHLYEFPLIQGENKEKTDYFAFIKDSSFPLEHETECRLNLTYTYGKDYPYNLEFIPVTDNAEFKSVVVKWENTSHRDYIHIPGPEYAQEDSWEKIQTISIGNGRQATKILEALDQSIENTHWLAKFGWGKHTILSQVGEHPIYKLDFFFHPLPFYSIQCSCNAYKYSSIDKPKIFISQSINSSFIKELDRTGKIQFVAYDWLPAEMEHRRSNYFRESLPILNLWNQGRSSSDSDFPQELSDKKQRLVENALKLLANDTVPKPVKDEVYNLLAAFHCDAPSEAFEYLKKIIGKTLLQNENEKESLYCHERLINAFGYIVGNAELDEQKEILRKEISLTRCKKTITKRYGIEILGIALWRTRKCISNLSVNDVQSLLQVSVEQLNSFMQFYQDKLQKNIWANPLALKKNSKLSIDIWSKRRLFLRTVELILALFRVRESEDDKLLSAVAPAPENKNIQALIKLMPKLKDFCKGDQECYEKVKDYAKDKKMDGKSYRPLKSRIHFTIEDKDRDPSIPDYMYALEKFTNGEDCNIRILRVDDDQE